jgi:hypothetical protein
VDADPFHTRSHDLSFDALNSEDSFRAEVRRLAEIIMHVMNIPTDAFSVDWIVDEAVKQDFQEELNPTMTNGNLPTEKEKAAETEEETEEETAEETYAETSGDAPVADEAAAAANETTASTPVVNADFQEALIEDAMEDVVEETSSEVSAEEEAIDDAVGEEVGEIEATNDAVATQIETITQNVETLEASAMAKESVSPSDSSVVSSSRVDENEKGVDVEPGVVWSRRDDWDAAASGKGALRLERHASRHSESDMDIAEEADAEEPEEWVSGASGFDDAEDDAELATRAF